MSTKQRRALLDYADWWRLAITGAHAPKTSGSRGGLALIQGTFAKGSRYDKNWAHTAESLAYDGNAVPSTRRAR